MSIGATLQAGRLDAGLSVQEVSSSTRIREALIRAIEADNFQPCGGATYARGHIRAIATAVGLDAAPLIAEFNLAEGGTQLVPAGQILDRTEIAHRSPSGPNWTAAMLVTAVLLAAVAFVTLLTGPNSGDKPDSADGSSAAAIAAPAQGASGADPAAPLGDEELPSGPLPTAVVPGGNAASGATGGAAEPGNALPGAASDGAGVTSPKPGAVPSSTAPANVATAPAASQPAPTKTPSSPPAASPAPGAVASTPADPAPSSVVATAPAVPSGATSPSPTDVLAFSGVSVKVRVLLAPCWVRVTDTSATRKVLFQGVLERGVERDWSAASGMSITFGDAGAVSLTVNGRDIGAPGGRGAVVTERFVPGDPTAG